MEADKQTGMQHTKHWMGGPVEADSINVDICSKGRMCSMRARKERHCHSSSRENSVWRRSIPLAQGHSEDKAWRQAKAYQRKDSQRMQTICHLMRCQMRVEDRKNDAALSVDEPPLDVEVEDEGLKVFVQTGKCQRKVWTKIYRNTISSKRHILSESQEISPYPWIDPTIPCCDLCCPDLLNQVHPGVPPKPPKETKLKKGVPCLPTQARLWEWQALIKKRDFTDSLFRASGFLKDKTIVLLSAVGPMEAQEDLEWILADEWSWYDKYGQELFTFFTTLNVPPLVPIPCKSRAKKSRLLEKSMSTSKRVWGKETEAERPGKQVQMESETTLLTKMSSQVPAGWHWTDLVPSNNHTVPDQASSTSINHMSQPPDATRNYYHYVMLTPYPSPMTPSHPFIPAPFESSLVPETPSNRPSYYRLPQTPQSQNPYYRTGTYNTPQSPIPQPDHTQPDQYCTMNLAWMGYYMYPHQSLPSVLAPPGLMIQPSNHPPNHLYWHPLSFQGHLAPPWSSTIIIEQISLLKHM